MKSIYSTILDESYNSLETLKKDTGENLERFDTFMVWVVGFATVGITILIGNIEASKKYLGTLSVKVVIVLFAVCIIAGIAYRYAHIFVRHYDVRIMHRISMTLKDLDLPPSRPDDVSGLTDYEQWVIMLKVYNLDWSNTIEAYRNATDAEKEIFMRNIKHRFEFEADWATREFDAADKFIQTTIQDAYKLSDKRMEQIRNTDYAMWLKRFSKLYNYALFISLFSFVSCIILVVISYLYLN